MESPIKVTLEGIVGWVMDESSPDDHRVRTPMEFQSEVLTDRSGPHHYEVHPYIPTAAGSEVASVCGWPSLFGGKQISTEKKNYPRLSLKIL